MPSPQDSTSAKLVSTASSRFFLSIFLSEFVTKVTGLLLSRKTQSTVFLIVSSDVAAPSEVIFTPEQRDMLAERERGKRGNTRKRPRGLYIMRMRTEPRPLYLASRARSRIHWTPTAHARYARYNHTHLSSNFSNDTYVSSICARYADTYVRTYV